MDVLKANMTSCSVAPLRCAATFDAVLRSKGAEIVRTPYRSPRANAGAERWVGSLRRECLDHLLILSERHLQRVLAAFVAYDNKRRRHQGLRQQCPVPRTPNASGGRIARREVLGGIIHDDCQDAA
jgi:transposase InsO family protein